MKNLLQYNSFNAVAAAIKILAKNASDLDFYKKENSIIIKNNFLDDMQQDIITKIKNNQIKGIICVYHSSQYINLSVVNNDDYFMKKIYKHLKKLKHKIIVNEIEQLKTDVSKLKREIEQLKNPIIKT